MASPSTQTSSFVFNSRPKQGRNAHIFQPPPPYTTTSTDYFSPSARKRSRADSSLPAPSFSTRSYTPRTSHNTWSQYPSPGDGGYSGPVGDASGFINDRYTLAGGLDTPALREIEREEARFSNSNYNDRRRTRDDGGDTPMHNHMAPLSGPLARERNGAARVPSFQESNDTSVGWAGLAFGFVGKVFNFSTNVIRGFYAGGGTGFDLQHSNASPSMWESGQQVSTPLPGAWREDDYFDGDFEQDNPASASQSVSRPAHKRRQTDRETWVMVGTPDPNDPSPRRKVSGGATPRSSTLAVRPAASRAPNRRNLAPMSRRQSSYVSYAGSPVQPHYDGPRRASVAPTRSPHSHSRPSSSGPLGSTASYMSPEAERYAKRQAKQDRAADKTMTSMSRKLEDLIRQGQEALGTKISIEDDGTTDEGFVDDEW